MSGICVDSTAPDDSTTVVDALPRLCSCGGPLLVGYGFAGGGMGPYALCMAPVDCGRIYKVPEPANGETPE